MMKKVGIKNLTHSKENVRIYSLFQIVSQK